MILPTLKDLIRMGYYSPGSVSVRTVPTPFGEVEVVGKTQAVAWLSEEIGVPTPKPFDLEAAKAGAALVTRDGQHVSEFHYFESREKYKVVCIINGKLNAYGDSGEKHHPDFKNLDLFMAPVPQAPEDASFILFSTTGFKRFESAEAARAHRDQQGLPKNLQVLKIIQS